MERRNRELFSEFQCDHIRKAEEIFAQTLSENQNVRLFFINDNQAFTDGKVIVVDPAADELFVDEEALEKTGNYLGWPRDVLKDPWNALHIITRAQTIHECLHLLYTDFPGRQVSDPKCDTRNKKTVMGLISNIIEDAYIEAAGCSLFDNMEFYLKFGRVSLLFASHPSDGTVTRTFGNALQVEELMQGAKSDAEECLADEKRRSRVETNANEALPVGAVSSGEVSGSLSRTECEQLTDFLDHMATFLLYPMVYEDTPQEDISEYVEKAKPLFLEGSTGSSPEKRYAAASRIFDVISHLVPPDTVKLHMPQLTIKLGGRKTHSGEGVMGAATRKGRELTVSSRLFTGRDGSEKENAADTDALMRGLEAFAEEKDVLRLLNERSCRILKGSQYGCAAMHKRILIRELKPRVNQSLRLAYQNIVDRYRGVIRTCQKRLSLFLSAPEEEKERKLLLGSGIDSRYLTDRKKCFWYRETESEGAQSSTVLLLIDGSGSMEGGKRENALHLSVILHEVFRAVRIPHALVEHRATPGKPEIEFNILVDFHGLAEEKLNLMRIEAFGGNRDGLALYWAERYLMQHAQGCKRLLFVLSDGIPSHDYGGYEYPLSDEDTALAAKKIKRRGTGILGVSLEEWDDVKYNSYDFLMDLYSDVTGSQDVSKAAYDVLEAMTERGDAFETV